MRRHWYLAAMAAVIMCVMLGHPVCAGEANFRCGDWINQVAPHPARSIAFTSLTPNNEFIFGNASLHGTIIPISETHKEPEWRQGLPPKLRQVWVPFKLCQINYVPTSSTDVLPRGEERPVIDIFNGEKLIQISMQFRRKILDGGDVFRRGITNIFNFILDPHMKRIWRVGMKWGLRPVGGVIFDANLPAIRLHHEPRTIGNVSGFGGASRLPKSVSQIDQSDARNYSHRNRSEGHGKRPKGHGLLGVQVLLATSSFLAGLYLVIYAFENSHRIGTDAAAFRGGLGALCMCVAGIIAAFTFSPL